MLAVYVVAVASCFAGPAGRPAGQRAAREAGPLMVRRFEHYTKKSCKEFGCWPLENKSECISATYHVFEQKTQLVSEYVSENTDDSLEVRSFILLGAWRGCLQLQTSNSIPCNPRYPAVVHVDTGRPKLLRTLLLKLPMQIDKWFCIYI